MKLRWFILTCLLTIIPQAAMAQSDGILLPASDEISQNMADDAAGSKKNECFEAFTYANALMRAENAYVRRQYTTVIEILRPIFENISCVEDASTVLEIDLLLGVAYFEQNNQNLAESFFMNVLRSEPDHIVGSIITLPESSARFIEELRNKHAEELEKLRKASSPNTLVESLYVQVEKEIHPYWMNFMPFGIGVYQMHQNGWAIAYASLQVSGIALSILGGGMVEYYRGDNNMFSSKNYQTAKNWQAVQITGIALLAASYVAGVIHALVIHEDSTMIIHSPTSTQPDFAAAAPFILDDGGGIAFQGTF